MTDIISAEQRSRLMSRIRSKGSVPEQALRKMLTEMGYRYRLHYRGLAGKPDLAMPGRRVAIWVHGCFWHQHPRCHLAVMPKSRPEFWAPKLEANRRRDEANEEAARASGWTVLVVWECELRRPDRVRETLRVALDSSRHSRQGTR